MSGPRPPLSAAKVQRTRLLLAVATIAVAVGGVVAAATGHGLWRTGIIGWVALVVAVTLGAGTDNAAVIVGLGGVAARLRARAAEADPPHNDADWS